MKDCDECVFGIYWSFGNDGNSIIQMCHAKNMTDEESVEMVESNQECEMYAEGNELYKRYKNGEFENIPASQKHIIDKKDFSEHPTATCGHKCGFGENGCCYSKIDCTYKTK